MEVRLVESVYVDFVGKELEAVSKITLWTTEPCLNEDLSRIPIEEICNTLYGDVARPSNVESFRQELLRRSYHRSDKSVPPYCFICLNPLSEMTNMCGTFRWMPDYPNFFGFHELCMLTARHAIGDDADKLSDLETAFFNIKLKTILHQFRLESQNRSMCSYCRTSGAMLECNADNCNVKYHYPCGIGQGMYCSYDSAEFYSLCRNHSKSQIVDRQHAVFEKLVSFAVSPSDREDFAITCQKAAHSDCFFCKKSIFFDPDNVILNGIVMSSCCGFHLYHFDCIQKHVRTKPFLEIVCPRCRGPNLATQFHRMLWLQGVYTRELTTLSGCPEDSSYFSMCCAALFDQEGVVKCLNPQGPFSYDITNMYDHNIFVDFEPLNQCIVCSVNCHRACAGPPWSLYVRNEEEENEEPIWKCSRCSSKNRPRSPMSISLFDRPDKNATIANSDKNPTTKRSIRSRPRSVSGGCNKREKKVLLQLEKVVDQVCHDSKKYKTKSVKQRLKATVEKLNSVLSEE